jgi:hypothetical protein
MMAKVTPQWLILRGCLTKMIPASSIDKYLQVVNGFGLALML